MRETISKLTRHLFVGISGTELNDEEKSWLTHPLVGGIILFTRNYQSKQQLTELTASIKKENPNLLISVDQEGGRVQRFCEEFTRIPPMRSLGELYDSNPREALEEAETFGDLIAQELIEVGVDFSYVPVCDIDYGRNSAIGDRAFHSDPEAVTKLVEAFYKGLHRGGSIGVAKHFPGHGYVEIDTHVALAEDNRSLDELKSADLKPFTALIEAGIEGIMPAHIIYPALDPDHTAVSSKIWLDYLRSDMGFTGVIISDDLDMQGANHLGDVKAKVEACFNAGINIVLLCNDMAAIREILK